MDNKVVINACYGGFSLSKEAVMLGRELSCDAKDWIKCDPTYGYLDVSRHDKILVAVVESLGVRASGACAKLEIVLTGQIYRISEHDGYESIEEPKGLDWVMIQC